MKGFSLWWVSLVVAGLAGIAATQGSFLQDAMYVISDAVKSVVGGDQTSPPNRLEIDHVNGVTPADFSSTGLPKVRMGARVMDLINGIQFDEILMDSPAEMRPPSVVAFYDSNDATCMEKFQKWDWDSVAENSLPSRDQLFTARYDMYSAPRRAWWKFVPEMDLAKRFGVKQCPELVFASRRCEPLDWCVNEEKDGIQRLGCDDYKSNCDTETWDQSGSLKQWIMKMILQEKGKYGTVKVAPFLKSYKTQEQFLLKRDHTSADNMLRNIYLAQAFPAYTDSGFKAMPIPKEFQDWMVDFLNRPQNRQRTEHWDAESTQMSFIEKPTQFVDLDRVRSEKERMANKYLKPIVEKWAGLEEGSLELTSFYGIRIYPDGSFLKNHVDRIDTHVLSVTMCVAKLDEDKSQADPWPLEVISWEDGMHTRYKHDAGTMVLYESSKLPHGRPYRNKGGPHAGAFLHFKPVKMTTKDAEKWDQIAARARAHQAAHTQWGRFRSTEPSDETPQFTEEDYGSKAKWRYNDKSSDDSGLSVQFKNQDSGRAVEVYWVSPDGAKVHQGTLGPNAQFEINTFPNHKFIFTNQGSKEALPGGKVTIDAGKRLYSYKFRH